MLNEEKIVQEELVEENCEKNKDRAEKRKLSLRHKARFAKIAKKTKIHGNAKFSTRKNKSKRAKEIEKQAARRAKRMVKTQLKAININNPEYDNIYNTFEMYEKQAMPSHMLG